MARTRQRGRSAPSASRSVPGTLAVAAGYGLAISALTVLTAPRMFGTTGAGGRIAAAGMTVAILVSAAALMCVRRSWHRRRPGRGA
jgi:Na+/proline symporter